VIRKNAMSEAATLCIAARGTAKQKNQKLTNGTFNNIKNSVE
jgi:hypothetical protein